MLWDAAVVFIAIAWSTVLGTTCFICGIEVAKRNIIASVPAEVEQWRREQRRRRINDKNNQPKTRKKIISTNASANFPPAQSKFSQGTEENLGSEKTSQKLYFK